jgi:hypothetical protein
MIQQALELPIYRLWMDGHAPLALLSAEPWVPACAGMTAGGCERALVVAVNWVPAFCWE